MYIHYILETLLSCSSHTLYTLLYNSDLLLDISVFGMLLGDTLILDNLDTANSYRQEVSVSSNYDHAFVRAPLNADAL